MLLKGNTIIWLPFDGSLIKFWEFWFFAGGFIVTIIFGTGLSLAQISQKWIMMLIWFFYGGVTTGYRLFLNMANLFDCDDRP